MNSPLEPPPSPAKKILLVDDNDHGLVARKVVLVELGYRVETARCAEEALRRFIDEKSGFDVVVTDLKMISMDGVELIRRLRDISPNTKTVLLSGFVEPLGLTEASTGADAVIMKSNLELEHLKRAIKNVLSPRPTKKPVASQKRPPAFMVKGS